MGGGVHDALRVLVISDVFVSLFGILPQNRKNLLLPPVTINPTKLDLGATAPPHDGNHSTCGYLGVIWTP